MKDLGQVSCGRRYTSSVVRVERKCSKLRREGGLQRATLCVNSGKKEHGVLRERSKSRDGFHVPGAQGIRRDRDSEIRKVD